MQLQCKCRKNYTLGGSDPWKVPSASFRKKEETGFFLSPRESVFSKTPALLLGRQTDLSEQFRNVFGCAERDAVRIAGNAFDQLGEYVAGSDFDKCVYALRDHVFHALRPAHA